MFLEVIYDISPFMEVFLWLIAILAFFFIIFDVKPCQDDLSGFSCTGEDDDYPGLERYFMMFVKTFRESTGDLVAPNYETWENKKDYDPKTSNVAIYFIWLVWLLNIFFTLIVMLNFLIAEVGATYNRVVGLGQKNHYKQAANVNKKVYLMFYFLRNWKYFQFDGIVFTTRQDKYTSESDQASQSIMIKEELKGVEKKMNQKMRDHRNKVIKVVEHRTNLLDAKFNKFLRQIGM